MFLRVFRPLRAPSASLVQTPIRFLLPIRSRTFATSTIETQAPASSPEISPLPKSSPPSPSPSTATITPPPTPEASAAEEAEAEAAVPTEAATPPAATPTEAPAPAPTASSPTKASPTKASPTKASPTKASPTKASPTKASPTKASPTKASAETPAPTPAPRQLPYFVARNPFENFGVYQRKKRGGNLKVTLVKKGEGNLQALKHDIKNALELRDDEVAVNSITRHIVVKGFRKNEVVHFLRTMGF